ncbi:MAG: MmgE/PrpD family protein [Dehalococcoidia bacterium]|nr:MmgE/PrpD family protein [Dehalococcoidia bacterium]
MALKDNGGGLTSTLASFYSALEYEDLSPREVDRAKYFCLDYLGVAIRGAVTPSSEVIQSAVKALSPDGDSVIMGSSLRASPEYAALCNGAAAHSIEMDDVQNDSSLHPAVATFPAAFACADLLGARGDPPVDGRRFIGAITAGYDVMVRIGKGLDPRRHYARGFHPTGTCGTFGAAVVASRLLGLDARETAWAMGVAGSQAAGSLEFLADGAWTKRMHPGWAAHSGIIGALLSSRGFVAPTTILEGRDGFLHGYTDDADETKVLEGLGDTFYINKVSIKPHACCRYNQGPLDCILEIVRENRLSHVDVEKVTVGVLQAGYNVVAAPAEQKRNPKNVVDAQFSMPFGAAVAILNGRATLDEYTEESLSSPLVKQLMDRVVCVRDPALEANYPSRWPAWAEVTTGDGRTLRAEIEFPKGDPENALSWQEIKDKFRNLTGPVIPADRQEAIIASVDSLESLEDVRDLAALTAL